MEAIKKDIIKLYELSSQYNESDDKLIEEFNNKKFDINEYFNDEFTIYVDGIFFVDSNESNINKLETDITHNNLGFYNLWNDGFRQYILSLIPKRFKRINIVYYEDIKWNKNNNPTEEKGTKLIKEYLIDKDHAEERVSSRFNFSILPINIIDKRIHSCICIDFKGYMNIYKIYPYRIMTWTSNYEGSNLPFINHWLVFINEVGQKRRFHNEVKDIPIFVVNPDNTVTTLYDKLIKYNIEFLGTHSITKLRNTIELSWILPSDKLHYGVISNYKMAINKDLLNSNIIGIYASRLFIHLKISAYSLDKLIVCSLFEDTFKSLKNIIQDFMKSIITPEVQDTINKKLDKFYNDNKK